MSDEGFRVDGHVKILDETVVQRAKARGLDAIVYAPHFERLPTIRERAERFSDDDLRVFPARELFTGNWQRRRHVLAVGLDEPVPDFLTLDGTLAELRRQDAAVMVPHPGFLTVSLTAEEVAEYSDTIDAVETYNPKYLPHHSRRARRIADDTGLPAFATSYAHLRGTVGEVWTEFERAFETVEEYADAIKAGTAGEIRSRRGPVHALRRGLEFAHLGYENSWKKFDRIMLQGTEPTHPDHVAYEGKFDDVKVY
ncbi:MAG: PHP-associated domain-containing protein [Haloarculaceae archaeon]